MAAAGITWLFSLLDSRVNLRKWPIFSVLTTAITVFLCLQIYSTGSPSLSCDTTGVFVEAEPVARFLKEYIRPGDEIISSLMPVYAPLSYYLNSFGIHQTLKACWTSGSSEECKWPAHGLRVLTILKTGHRVGRILPQMERFDGVFNERQNDLGDILYRHGVSDLLFFSPRLIYKIGSARVYESVRYLRY